MQLSARSETRHTCGWCILPDFTLTAQAVQQPILQACGRIKPCSSASHRMYLHHAEF